MKQPTFSSAVHPVHGVLLTRAYLFASMFLAVGLAGGCNKGPAPAAPAAQPATTAQAPAPAPAEQPGSVSSTPAPSGMAANTPPPAPPAATPAPAAVPARPPAPVEYTVPAGTSLVVRVGQTLSSKESSVGDSFTGTLAQSVVVRGVNLLRAGTPVTGTVVAAKGQGRFKGSGDLGVSISRVGNYAVSTSTYEKEQSGKGKRSAALIGGGGGGGALIGGLAGGGKGALIGGLLGAGAGTAGAAFTGNKAVTIPAETVITFRLAAPVTVTRKAAE
jgi:hypothetical protein